MKTSRGKFADDPMVTLLPSHLRAAMEDGGWTISGLVKRMGKGENRQTIHHLRQGDEPIRCRRTRRKRLARILEVPDPWLGGEPIEPFPLPGFGHLELAYRRSPRVGLAMARLMRRCLLALERDLATCRAEPDSGPHWRASDEVRFFASWTVGQLTTPHEWQRSLLLRRPVPQALTPNEKRWFDTGEPPGLDAILRISPEEEAASLSLIRAMDFVFTPWFRDEATLDYGQLAKLVDGVAIGSRALLPSSDRPNVIVMANGHRASPKDPNTPYALVRWPAHRKPHQRGGSR